MVSRECILLIKTSSFSESVIALKGPAVCEEIFSDLHVLSHPKSLEEVIRTYHENRLLQLVITSFFPYVL